MIFEESEPDEINTGSPNVSHFAHSTLKSATTSFRTTNSGQVLFFVSGPGSRKVILVVNEVQILFCACASKRNTKFKIPSEITSPFPVLRLFKN